MANRQSIPGINTNVNSVLVSSKMQAANMQSPWRQPDVGGLMQGITKVAGQYYQAEKEAAFKRLDLEADKFQLQELEEIRKATSNEQIPQIEQNFQVRVNEAFSQDSWGKQWLKERSELYFAANGRDVMRHGLAKQHELGVLELNKTIGAWTDNISGSAPDKAKVLIGDMNNFIDASPILSPEEKQKTKENATNMALERLASSNPNTAIALLKDETFTKGKNLDAKGKIDSLIKKQFADMRFQEQVKIFNNERELSEKLDDMAPDAALRLLEQNEGNVSNKYFKAKEAALLSAKGITAETRAATAADFMMRIAALPKNAEEVERYYQEANEILTDLEKAFADGTLTTKDKKSLRANIYRREGNNLEVLKQSNAGSALRFWGYSYKDAAEDIDARYTGTDKNKVMLEYFRRVNDGEEYSTEQKKAILQGVLTQANANELNRPSFATYEEAKAAYNAGKIKKGDRVYINGIGGTI